MTVEDNIDIIKKLEDLNSECRENLQTMCILVNELYKGKEIRVFSPSVDLVDDNLNKYDKCVLIGEEVIDCLLSEARRITGDNIIKIINSFSGIPIIRISNEAAFIFSLIT